MIRSKDKNIAAVRLNKIVGKFVNEHLVACVNCASSNDFTAMVNATRENVEVMTQAYTRKFCRWQISREKVKKKRIFFGTISEI